MHQVPNIVRFPNGFEFSLGPLFCMVKHQLVYKFALLLLL